MTMKLRTHISVQSFDLASNHPIIVKLSQIHGFSGGYVSRITKDGAYIKSYTSPDAGVFLTNDELNQRLSVKMGAECFEGPRQH
jgi:hypothetical protein